MTCQVCLCSVNPFSPVWFQSTLSSPPSIYLISLLSIPIHSSFLPSSHLLLFNHGHPSLLFLFPGTLWGPYSLGAVISSGDTTPAPILSLLLPLTPTTSSSYVNSLPFIHPSILNIQYFVISQKPLITHC